MSKQPIKI